MEWQLYACRVRVISVTFLLHPFRGAHTCQGKKRNERIRTSSPNRSDCWIANRVRISNLFRLFIASRNICDVHNISIRTAYIVDARPKQIERKSRYVNRKIHSVYTWTQTHVLHTGQSTFAALMWLFFHHWFFKYMAIPNMEWWQQQPTPNQLVYGGTIFIYLWSMDIWVVL